MIITDPTGAKKLDSSMSQNILNPQDFTLVIHTGPKQEIARPSLSYWQDAWIRLKANKQALISLIIICLLLLFTLIGPLVWRVDPAEQILSRISESPSLTHSAIVLPPLKPFVAEVIPTIEAAPQADGAILPAPTNLEWLDKPSVQSVRMRWTPVNGAAGYLIYRSLEKPRGGFWGLPVGTVTSGNIVSFEDTFNLKPETIYYSVLAQNGATSTHAITREITLTPGIALNEARVLQPNTQPGDKIDYPLRPFGTDYLGRDLLARLMSGARVSLFIGLFAPFISILIGIIIGGLAGFFGGATDQWLMRFSDFVLGLPFLLFMILFRVALGKGAGESGITPMLIAWVALAWPGAARLTRGQILQLREAEFVQAARIMGAKPFYLLIRHLLPNTFGVILVSLTFAIPGAIFTEAFLSFIGMGVAPPTASWGSMCNDGIQTFLTYPHEFLTPALFISIAVLAFNLLGDGLRDALDPKLRSTP
ncbi:MAG: ABC transporter permease [Deltaproteobacteria bacterium]|nr:ABC transporter permease [Deltaproteobacteria bacterium]